MAKTFTAPFVQTLELKTCKITGATTDKTGATTTNLVTLCTGGTNGSKITEIGYIGQGDLSDATILIFHLVSGVYTLIDEIEVTANTSTNTTVNGNSVKTYTDLGILSGESIVVGITVYNETVAVFAKLGAY